mgnify:CR=1 FL=1|tara:strand:- start:234 stop:476 length:243 start_codon:yes stop_codon:yes gene_type:complete
MKRFVSSSIRLVTSLGKFGFIIYTISLVNISLISSENFRYLKSGYPIMKLSATYIQDRTNSNIRRKIREILENNIDGVIS